MRDDKASLLTKLRAAFPDPVWPRDKLAHTGYELEGRYIEEHYQGKRWTELTPEELGWTSQDAWAFTDEALAFFLPAFMNDDLVNSWEHLDRMSHWLDGASTAIIAKYDDAQARVLLEVLNFLFLAEPDYGPRRLMQQLTADHGS